MTKTFLKGALLAAVAATATPAFANPAPFTATAEIRKPLTITKNNDLDFGTITMGNALSSASVSVAASSGATASCGAGLTCTNPSNPADFSVDGVGTQVVDLDYGTPPVTLVNTDGSGDTVAFSLNAPASVSLTSGAGTFYVGGSITVDSTTTPGVYENSFTVTGSYQ